MEGVVRGYIGVVGERASLVEVELASHSRETRTRRVTDKQSI